eukprot:CAMPEP_0118928836 /NCGR_PEP_ID=MMETSP1169-20130426/5998_1 /TAXON_ID=36882 /ORGANISM="Pyramimonas obovata, Strain CCMP722" /LENGTH=40 /DNA_ID= /DNA_START= /DNA_END= /DNA_ORIENTATION=
MMGQHVGEHCLRLLVLPAGLGKAGLAEEGDGVEGAYLGEA